MSPQKITTTQHTSWFSRITSSLTGILLGIALLIASLILLFWNEGRAVRRSTTLKQGQKDVLSIPNPNPTPQSKNQGKLLHVQGKAQNQDSINDPSFNLEFDTLKAKRVVEVYQWVEDSQTETKTKIGGGQEKTTTYTYAKKWSDSLIDSSNFHESLGHENPDSLPYEDKTFTANKITVGGFQLGQTLTAMLNNFSAYQLSQQDIETLPESIKDQAKLHNNYIYLGENINEPQVGDLRINFKVSKPSQVSIIAKQNNDTLESYSYGKKGQLALLEYGQMSAEDMFQSAHLANQTMTWLLRLAGFILMMISITIILKPIRVLGDIIPFVGKLLGFSISLIAFMIALILSSITIAIAWFSHRPILSVSLIGGAILIVLLLRFGVFTKAFKKNKK